MIFKYSLKHSKDKLGEPLLGTEVETDGFYADKQSDMFCMVLDGDTYWFYGGTVWSHGSIKKYSLSGDKRFCPMPEGAVITVTQDHL